MTTKATLFIIVSILFLLGCKNEITFSEKIDAIIANDFKADEPGGSFIIIKNDRIVYSNSFGVEDIVTKKPITSASLFNLGSISKTFVANGILILNKEGKLNLSDSLIKYFPAFKNQEIGKQVTIKHLLTHTSGLPDNRRDLLDSIYLLTAKDEENFAPLLQNDSLLFDAGSQYEYSNPAYNALALIIEKVSGQKWQAFIAESILKPAGMATSTITDGPHPSSGVTHGYLKINGTFSEKDYGEEPTFAASGNGGVWSSIDELIKYEVAIQHNTFMDQETITKSRTIQEFSNWNSATPPFIGYSWFVENTHSLKAVYHTGSQGGFLCDYYTVPEKGIVYIALCNTPKPLPEYRTKVVALLKDNNWLD